MPPRYYYSDAAGTVVGPLDLITLQGMARQGLVNGATLICQEGTESWLPLGSLTTLAPPTPPPLQPQFVYTTPPKSRALYIVLALILGGVGIHNFYAGYTGKGLIMLLLGITGAGLVLTVPWAIINCFTTSRDANGVRMA